MSDNANRRSKIKSRFERVKEWLKKFKAGLTTSLVVSIIIHIAMIIIGAINLKKCPASSNIPIFLLVQGVIGILSKILSLGRDFFLRYFKVGPILSVIGFVELAFLICGSVWVYGAFEPKYDPAYGDLYCDRTVYLFALIFISCIYIFIFIILFVVLCAGICICVAAAVADDVDVEATPPERAPLPTIRNAD